MVSKRKKLNILLIIIAVLLAVGIVVVYIIGEKRMNQGNKKKITGASEVNAADVISPSSETKTSRTGEG